MSDQISSPSSNSPDEFSLRPSTDRAHDPDAEKQHSTDPEAGESTTENPDQKKTSVYAGLGWLDRLLVLWILLAIIIGILLGNFVDSVGPALQSGKFVGVSVPIGKFTQTHTTTHNEDGPSICL